MQPLQTTSVGILFAAELGEAGSASFGMVFFRIKLLA